MRIASRALYDALGRPEIHRIAKAKRILADWSAVVGPELAQRSFPDRYSAGVVWVAVEGSAWAQELRMRKGLFLERLREAGRDDTLFTDMRFGVRKWRERPVTETAIPTETPDLPNPNDGLTIREIARRRLAHWPDRQP